MECITVSTKYDDLLKIVLPQNSHFFERWHIITHPKDFKTIEAVREFDKPNINLIFFDFYARAEFNKGGGIQYCLSAIPQQETVFLLDSDIYLPDNFLQLIKEVEPDTLYAPEERIDFDSRENFANNKFETYANNFHGFFQLFINDKKYSYADSSDASKCDEKFRDLFPNKRIIKDMKVKHLGQPKVNWKGREAIDFL